MEFAQSSTGKTGDRNGDTTCSLVLRPIRKIRMGLVTRLWRYQKTWNLPHSRWYRYYYAVAHVCGLTFSSLSLCNKLRIHELWPRAYQPAREVNIYSTHSHLQ